MVGRGEKSIHDPCSSLFWEVRPAGMIDYPKEANLRGNCWVHALRVREKALIPWQEEMVHYIEEQNKPASVWQGWMSHSPGGRQVCPDQTKAVKGQDGKTLATADAIKRLLPCPVWGDQK